MTQEEQLLDAVCRFPEEDTPRLAYADWLDEQGGPENTDRALYIRSAIESETIPDCRHMRGDFKYAPECRSCELDELLQWFSHNPTEGRPDRAWTPHQWLKVGAFSSLKVMTYWRRGFVHAVDTTLRIGDFISHAHEFAKFPLSHVRVRDKFPSFSYNWRYIWEDRGDSGSQGHVIPKKLWDPKILTPSGTYEEALGKFSQVCINFIRVCGALKTKR
jgi:uncharacterized protein (TIGR02996 family)